jgi:hypothetical protein
VAKRLWKIAVLVLLVTAVAAGWRLPAAHASNPGTISFQGKVTNANGTNVTDGSYPFVFKLYGASSGGTALWTETDSLSIHAGVFQVNLGANTSLSGIDFNANPSLYLGITFNSDPAGEMSPRVQLQSVPYAFNADKVGGLTASQLVQLSPGSGQTGFINISGGNTSINSGGSGTTAIGGSSGALTIGGASAGTISLQTGGSNAITLQSANALNFTAGAASTWNLGSNTLAITSSKFNVDTSGNTTLGGNLTVQGTGTSSIAGTLSLPGTGNTANLIDLGANIPAIGQNLLIYHGGTYRTGLGIQAGVFRLFTNTGSTFSFGHVSIADGTTYSEDVRIDATGNLVVGTAGAASARLVVAGPDATSSGAALNVTNSTSTSLLYVRDDGNVGIGTTSPAALFSVGASSQFQVSTSGVVKLTNFTSAGVVHSSAAGVLSDSAVVLGTDTSGNYVASLGTLSGLSTTGNSGAGSTPTLSVQYGSTAGTATQGNVTFACPAAGTNLSGGGNTITEGSGGTCSSLAVVSNPTFSGLVTANAGLTVVGATNINASGTAATNIGTGSSGAVTIGGGSNTFQLSSNHVDISTAGAVSGVTTLTAQTINATSSYQANGAAGINESCPNNDFINSAVVNQGILTGDGGCQTRGLSDERLKVNIVSLSDSTLDQLAAVNPVNFYFDCSNSFFSSTRTVCDPSLQTGVVAQQLQSIFPQLISQDEFGYYHVDYQGLSVEALKGVSELAQHINAAGDANLNSIISSSLTSDGALSLDSGSTGDVSIDTGSAANVNIGTGLAGAVNLSRTGQTTTVNGALLVDQAGDFAGDVTIGGNLTLSGSGFGLVGDNGQTVVSFDRSGNASFAGSLNLASASVSGGLTIGGDVTVGGLSTFQKLATFLARTVFRQDVEFDGHITVASDSAGYAALRSGESSVHVSFTAPYDNPPVVTASIVNGQFSLVSVNNVTAQGFDLSLSQPAAADTLLSWTALGVTNPQTAANPVPTP